MLTAEAIVHTADAGRYLARLRTHTGKMGTHPGHQPRRHGNGGIPPEIRHTEWSGASGTVTLSWGRWTARATEGTLTLRAEAADSEKLQRIQDMLTTRLENFGRREHLTITWQPPRTVDAGIAEAGQPAAGPRLAYARDSSWKDPAPDGRSAQRLS